MKELKIRALVGSIVGMVTSLACIFLLFMPMLVEIQAGAATADNVLYSVFDSMFQIGYVSQILGDATLYVASSALMIIFFALSIILFVLFTLSLVSICLNDSQPKVSSKLNMALSLRVISLITSVLGTIATILLAFYFEANGLTQTTFGYGTIVSLVVSLLNIGAAFTIPTNMEKKRMEKKIQKATIID